jgi:Domain of unknown function (DUF4915)
VPREGLIGASALGGFRQRSYLLPELAKDGDRPSKPLLSQAREELVHGPGRLLHAIPFVLRAAVAAALRHGARAHRPLPLEWPGDGRRPPALRHGAGGDRHAGRLACRQGQGRHCDRRGQRRRDRPRAVEPHSPRWYAGRLWVCESGTGTLGYIDPCTEKYEPIATVPGFTRGLDLVGNLAFVGLSQVRESAVFSGIPITERLREAERTCGVCVVDLTTGQVVALLRFETSVQEVFAVTVLAGRRYPELINDDDKLLQNSFVVPDAALVDVPATLRGGS